MAKIIQRRSFLTGAIASLIVAPAIVRPGSIMKVKPIPMPEGRMFILIGGSSNSDGALHQFVHDLASKSWYRVRSNVDGQWSSWQLMKCTDD